MAGVPRALALVWESNRGYTIGMAVFSILFGILPAVSAWISKLLIDAVVAAVERATPMRRTPRWSIELVLLQLGIAAGHVAAADDPQHQPAGAAGVDRQPRATDDHAATPTGSTSRFFENPHFYDSLQQAQREAGYRPRQHGRSRLFGLLRSLITFLSMIALIARPGLDRGACSRCSRPSPASSPARATAGRATRCRAASRPTAAA